MNINDCQHVPPGERTSSTCAFIESIINATQHSLCTQQQTDCRKYRWWRVLLKCIVIRQSTHTHTHPHTRHTYRGDSLAPPAYESLGEIKNRCSIDSQLQRTSSWLPVEKEMATHSSVLAWRIPGMVEPDGLPSKGSHRVGHD